MRYRRSAIIATATTALCCGLPGLVSFCIGPMAIYGAKLPESGIAPDEVNGVIGMGVVLICAGILGIIVPILVGLFTFRKPKIKPEDLNEPIPVDDF